jgi:hypothetical protein
MTEVVNIQRRGAKPPRAVRVPPVLTDHVIDDVLYGFGFEYFGAAMGTQRIIHISDDCLDEYGDAKSVMQDHGAELALYDGSQGEWVPVYRGDWVVEPQFPGLDGFIKLTDEEFHEEWEVIDE